jgi:hypothetical protein
MLDEIYDLDDSLTEDSYYDALLYLLGDAYPNLSEAELEDMLEDILDELPDHHAENILETVGTIAKKFGKGAMSVAAKNPTLVKGAFAAAGGFVGGPVGVQLGNKLGNALTKTAQNKVMPETGKVLKLMQDPQAQTAIARTSIGVGNGTAPLTVNGKTTLIATASYLRGMQVAIDAALKEMERHNVVPSEAYFESMPYSDDVDRQAEWLVEQLTGIATGTPPIAINENTFFIYSTGEMERYNVTKNEVLTYVFVDDKGATHNLGTFFTHWTQRRVTKYKASSKSNDLVEMVFIQTFQPYTSSKVKLGIKVWDSEEYKRYYVNPDCLAGLFGAMAINHIEDLKFSGASKKDGSPGISYEHLNGEIVDLGYLTTDFSGSGCIVGSSEFDYDRQVLFNESLYSFGFARNNQPMYSAYFNHDGNRNALLPHSKSMPPLHLNHLHVRGFDHSLVKNIPYTIPKPAALSVPVYTAEPDATRVFRQQPQIYRTK